MFRCLLKQNDLDDWIKSLLPFINCAIFLNVSNICSYFDLHADQLLSRTAGKQFEVQWICFPVLLIYQLEDSLVGKQAIIRSRASPGCTIGGQLIGGISDLHSTVYSNTLRHTERPNQCRSFLKPFTSDLLDKAEELTSPAASCFLLKVPAAHLNHNLIETAR